MGIFKFLKNIGRAVMGDPADDIQESITKELPGQIEGLSVEFDDGNVTLTGNAQSQAAREKAILLAGNVKGVENVNGDGLTAPAPVEVVEEAEAPPEPVFYTIQSGDSLSKIAREVYGNANKWPALFEANREVIKNPDLIYPGQQIRIPQDLD